MIRPSNDLASYDRKYRSSNKVAMSVALYSMQYLRGVSVVALTCSRGFAIPRAPDN